MKNCLIILFFCVFAVGGSTAFAQGRSEQGRNEKVEAAKVAFITDKVGLSADQAQKFWPVYNEYETKRRDLVKNYRSEYRSNLDEITEQEAKSRIEDMFEIKEKELALEKEYTAKFQRSISAKQVIMLYRAEREFTKMLLRRLDSGRAQN